MMGKNKMHLIHSEIRAVACIWLLILTGTSVQSAAAEELRQCASLRGRQQIERWAAADYITQVISNAAENPGYMPVKNGRECGKLSPTRLGAVFMFFFECPGGTNCDVNKTNIHVNGMRSPAPDLKATTQETGFYNANNIGFWRKEINDAYDAGIDFLLLNVYGPDLGKLQVLRKTIDVHPIGMKFSLFDDTWAWGKQIFGLPWQNLPSLADETSASLLYEAKWKPFFSIIPRSNWFEVNGRPVIFFYNAGTLKPLNVSSKILLHMKKLFEQEFGVLPLLVVDGAFFADMQMANVADAGFIWNSLGSRNLQTSRGEVSVKDGRSVSRFGALSVISAMTRWDSRARDEASGQQRNDSKFVQTDTLLRNFMNNLSGFDLAVIETWNDIAEGTSVNQAIDYKIGNEVLSSKHFIEIIKAGACRE